MANVENEYYTGTVQIYTGDGKGKTTGALGLAFRNLGHGRRVLIIQFMKGSEEYGEYKMSLELVNLDIKLSGRDDFVCREDPAPVDVELAQRGLLIAEHYIGTDDYDVIILDELNVALDFGLIELFQVKDLIQEKHPSVELIITGRNASEELINMADLVSEVTEIKHHYREGISARKGVEY